MPNFGSQFGKSQNTLDILRYKPCHFQVRNHLTYKKYNSVTLFFNILIFVFSGSRPNSASSFVSSFARSRADSSVSKLEERSGSLPEANEDVDVQSVINERRPSNLRGVSNSGTCSKFQRYSDLFVKEESADEEEVKSEQKKCTDIIQEDCINDEENDGEPQYVSIGVGPGNTELTVVVEDSSDNSSDKSNRRKYDT